MRRSRTVEATYRMIIVSQNFKSLTELLLKYMDFGMPYGMHVKVEKISAQQNKATALSKAYRKADLYSPCGTVGDCNLKKALLDCFIGTAMSVFSGHVASHFCIE